MGVKNNYFLPYWSKNYLIEEIVVKIFGSCEAHPFHSERRNKAKENTCSAEYAKSSHIVGLRSNQHTKIHMELSVELFLTRTPISKSDNIVNCIILGQFRQLKERSF